MSMDWFRSWHGAPTDNKWLVIAKRADVPAGMVAAVVWALFDYASQNCERGSVEGFDTETYAAFSGFDEAKIAAIIEALKEKNVIDDGILSAWAKRQPKREDNSSERVSRHRVTQCNATADNVTRRNASTENVTPREEKIREREETKIAPSRDFGDWPADFRDRFWQMFPHKVGKSDALAKLVKVKQSGVSWRVLESGVASYIRSKPPDRPWCNPATFLNQGRWEDQPANIVQMRRIPDV